MKTSNAAKVESPSIVARFAERESPHDNVAKPVILSDGRLLGLSLQTTGNKQEMFGRYSKDNGYSWSVPQFLFALPEHVGGFGYFYAFADRDGEVHVFYLNDGNTGVILPKSPDEKGVREGNVLDIWHVVSRHGATEWSHAKSIWTGRAGDPLSVIQLKSGRILFPISYMTPRSWSNRGGGFKEFEYVGTFSTSAIYSDDGGKTWIQSSDELVVAVPDLSTIGGMEPVVLELQDGRVWMLIRTQLGRFYESFSQDGGEHWTRPKPSSITASESPAALVRLPNQDILMIWNEARRYAYAYGGRQVLHAAISSDEGRTWRGHREIFRDPARKDPPPPSGDWGISYAFPVVARDGAVIFSAWVETGNARHMFRLDPRWLIETRQATDFSTGLDDWTVFGTRGVELVRVGQQSKSVLSIRRSDPEWPAGAVWNFPIGRAGTLKLRLMLRDGFGGNTLGLTDHYSVPFDGRDVFHNVFNFPIRPDGVLLGKKLTVNVWHDLEFRWDTARRVCTVQVDGKRIGSVDSQHVSRGINYLRFHATPEEPDSGLLVQSVQADVSEGWPR
ncbi:MAG TPA: sialidase family protein [Terriglobales bacterium]|nr:sialidase family protein [Terriglobales bacterium]